MSFCRIYQVVECRIMVSASSLQTQKVRVKFWNIVCRKSLNTIKSYKLFFCYAVKNKKMKRWKLIFTFIKHNKECFKLLTLKLILWIHNTYFFSRVYTNFCRNPGGRKNNLEILYSCYFRFQIGRKLLLCPPPSRDRIVLVGWLWWLCTPDLHARALRSSGYDI